jgi:putative oxidoreductase
MSRSDDDLQLDRMAISAAAQWRTDARKWLARICGWILGGTFLYAGISKMLDPIQLAHQIRNYQLAPWWMIHPAAIAMPWIEIIAGLLLILGIWAIEATVILSGLLVLFLAAIGWAMYLKLDIECGCFAGHAKVGWLKVAEDAVLLAIGLVGILARRGRN